MTKRIGFFGGTFDPIHFGHLNLAQEVMDKKELDEVWFCPARTNPFKIGQEHASIDHRLIMTQIATSEPERFNVIETEINRDGPSYTIDTLRELTEKFPDCQFFLVLSQETASELPKWKEAAELIRLAPPLVGSRKGEVKLEGNSEIQKIIKNGTLQTCVMDISSTEIRERLKKNLDCSDLVPKKVLDYIYKNRLYLEAN